MCVSVAPSLSHPQESAGYKLRMMRAADRLLASVLRAGVSHGYKRSETSPVARPGPAPSPPLGPTLTSGDPE